MSHRQGPETEPEHIGHPKSLHQIAERMLDQLEASLKAGGQSLHVEPWQQLAVELDCRIRDVQALAEVSFTIIFMSDIRKTFVVLQLVLMTLRQIYTFSESSWGALPRKASTSSRCFILMLSSKNFVNEMWTAPTFCDI